MTLEELGECIGVSYQQIQKYETVGNRIPGSTLYRLARVLHCDFGIFFEGIESGTGEPSVEISREDFRAARSLDRIDDPVLRNVLLGLIVLLDRGPRVG